MEMCQDTGFDLEQYLAERFGFRLARVLEPLFLNGAGTTEPRGVLQDTLVGALAAGSGTNNGSGLANGCGSDDLSNLELSLDVAYRKNAVFQVHPNTLNALRQTKDKQGRPLFPSLDGDRLLGYPILTNPNMDQLQVSAGSPPVTRKTVMLGDFSKYVIRRVESVVMRLEERFIDTGTIAYIMFQRFDGALCDGGGGAIKCLANTF
jgi:HK97 family phage major capsid protein